ncbi:MAG: hypothetical protein IJ711_11335 [Lachnospiraceae bacterium]|nr:hypothetical protein [Lachnospiraceae bacterium]
METTESKIERVKKMLYESQQVVCFIGIGAAMECGAINLFNQDEAYRIEEKYHYSPEEIYSTGFYSARTDFFYRFYHDEILSLETTPNETFHAIRQIEEWGKLRACVTSNIYNLPQKAGIYHVIELRGNIYNNYCTKCGMTYSLDYVRNAKGIPRCTRCGANVRPAIRLNGEMVRNDVMTAAANACQQADMLMILGTNFCDSSVMEILKYFQTKRLVLISKNEHYSDKQATVAIHDEVRKVLPRIVW